MFWITNTVGRKDAMLTFATFAFAVVTLNILLATVGTLTYKDFNVTFHTLDSSIMAVYMGATFTAYVSRRLTDKAYPGDPTIVQDPAQIDNEPTQPKTK